MLHYCMAGNTCTNEFMVQEVVRKVQVLAHDMNLFFNPDKPLYSVLHIYFCMFRGIRELLFKAGLQYLAVSINKVESYNMLPVLQVAAGTYKKFSQALGGYNHITCSQWEYLKACYKEKFTFQKKIFHFFKARETELLYEDYVIFYAKYKIINQYIYWPRIVSSITDLQRFMDEADYILLYVNNPQKWDELMKKQNARLAYLDYMDEHFIVTHPATIAEIFQEGEAQDNCLFNMFEEIAQGDRNIGYMRSSDKPEQSLVTFEVSEGNVYQLLGKHNIMLKADSPEFRWFTCVYIEKKGFTLSERLKRYYR